MALRIVAVDVQYMDVQYVGVNCCNFRQESNMALADEVKQLLKENQMEMEQ